MQTCNLLSNHLTGFAAFAKVTQVPLWAAFAIVLIPGPDHS